MLATLAGVALVGQIPAAHRWTGMALVVTANALATTQTRAPHGCGATPAAVIVKTSETETGGSIR